MSATTKRKTPNVIGFVSCGTSHVRTPPKEKLVRALPYETHPLVVVGGGTLAVCLCKIYGGNELALTLRLYQRQLVTLLRRTRRDLNGQVGTVAEQVVVSPLILAVYEAFWGFPNVLSLPTVDHVMYVFDG